MVRNSHAITHLWFANDSMLFFREKKRDCKKITSILKKYEDASSQQVILEKSSLWFSSNTSHSAKMVVYNSLDINRLLDGGKYLGLPLFFLAGTNEVNSKM